MKKTRTSFILSTALACQLAVAEPVPVHTQPFAELAIHAQHSAPATVVSDNQSRLSAELQAKIKAMPVRVGETVAKGTLLVQLDPTDFELAVASEKAALAAVSAKLDLAKYELNRAITLSKKQAVSEQILKQREADRDALLAEQQIRQAALQQAQRQVEKTKIRAPFRAVVLERLAQSGELAAPGTPLLRIVDIDNLELRARIQPEQADDLQHNTAPRLLYQDQQFPLSLRVITPALDTRARTREARLRFTSTPPLPGATGKLVWSSALASLPADLISQRDGKLGVFIREGDKARFITLPQAQTGRPVTTKLSPETEVITDGRYRLRDGDEIKLAGTPASH